MKKIPGFTLIEVLVTLTIVGVLLTFAVPYILDRPNQARFLKLENDFMAISTALSLYKLDNGILPSPSEVAPILLGGDQGVGSYLAEQPIDPWGTEYQFVGFGEGSMRIVSAGPNKTFDLGNESDDIFSKPIE